MNATARKPRPFGAFVLRDVGFRTTTTLLYVTHDELAAGRIAWLEKESASKSGYAIGTKVRRITASESRAWCLAGNSLPS